jgi:hypothetical protein
MKESGTRKSIQSACQSHDTTSLHGQRKEKKKSFFFFLLIIKIDNNIMRICYYDLLDLERQASPVDIKKAYRRQALVWHPGNIK